MGPGFESQRDHEKGQNEKFHFVPFVFQKIPNCQILSFLTIDKNSWRKILKYTLNLDTIYQTMPTQYIFLIF